MDTDLVAKHLACPKCHASLTRSRETLACTAGECGWTGTWKDDVAIAVSGAAPSFFDDKVEIMQAVHDDADGTRVFQDAQMRRFEETLRAGSVVLDVGCGPKAPYKRRRDCTIIGVDMSLASLRANEDVDLRVYASAAELPLADRSVDTVLCAYSVHHFVGTTVEENERLVNAAFREFGRVLAPGGELFVCEVAPWRPFQAAQRTLWNGAKRVLGGSLDMFFWGKEALSEAGERGLPRGTVLSFERFDAPWTSTFSPIFALPRLRIPRALYPFDMVVYRWRVTSQ